MPYIVEQRKRERGVFVKLPSNQVVDVLADAGLDFAVVDLEHSQLSEAEGIRLVEHSLALGFPALVRVPDMDRGAVNRLLEAGAVGIQLSTVRSVRQVRELRDAMLYPPAGRRSISLAHRGASYGKGGVREYLAAERERPPRMVIQLETGTTDDPLEEILGERPDIAFIGTTDLTVDLGLDEERVRARVEEIAAAAEAAGVSLGAFGLDDSRVVYDVVSSDVSMLAQAARGLGADS